TQEDVHDLERGVSEQPGIREQDDEEEIVGDPDGEGLYSLRDGERDAGDPRDEAQELGPRHRLTEDLEHSFGQHDQNYSRHTVRRVAPSLPQAPRSRS